MSHPRITVVTHALDRPQHLEQTIRSVIDQGYNNLEYVICDGGDSQAARIVQKFDGRFARHMNDAAENPIDAINKAFAGPSGQLHCLINSGDQLQHGSLLAAAKAFAAGHHWISGWSQILEPSGNQWPHLPRPHGSKVDWLTYNPMRWLANFWAAKFTLDLGGLSQDLQDAFEYDFWIRLALDAKVFPHVLRQCMGIYRVPADYLDCAKDDRYEVEAVKVQRKYLDRLSSSEQRIRTRRQKLKQSPVVLSQM
jgi:glycosyltransferase involved in cell wall biosynthesis